MAQFLGSISIDTFFSEYWQKKPLLIRQAFPDFECPVSPDELAGLACEEDVESRVVYSHHDNKAWQLDQGPFDEDYFSKLPTRDWSLLVQGVDHWVTELADLLDNFRFIPNWQLDDIMASFSPPGGSVGPHFDEYDVFLLQGLGEREWKVGQRCSHQEPCLKETPLRILEEFKEVNSWTLQPGDMLYLPPRIAHYGTAITDGITLSIGFRSPSHEEIIEDFTLFTLHNMPENVHLSIPAQMPQTHSGEISDTVLQQLRQILLEYSSPAQIAAWFGSFSTQPKSDNFLPVNESVVSLQDLGQLVSESDYLYWNEGSRFCFTQATGEILLFVDGTTYTVSGSELSFVQQLCQQRTIASTDLMSFVESDSIKNLLVNLLNKGSLYFE